MSDVIITYETLYDMLRKEKFRKELQELNPTFFKDVLKYIEEKKEILQSQEQKESVFASKSIITTRKQIENVQKILKDLYERRESKIIQIALFNSRMGTEAIDRTILLKEEQQLYDQIKGTLNNFRDNVLLKLMEGKMPIIDDKPKVLKTNEEILKNTKRVRFLQAVPKFVGDDMITYGPFEAEDVATLPVRVCDVLLKRERAEEI